MPMNPVSRITSRRSVNGTRGNEFHRLAPNAQRTFLLAGSRAAAEASELARVARSARRVIGWHGSMPVPTAGALSILTGAQKPRKRAETHRTDRAGGVRSLNSDHSPPRRRMRCTGVRQL